MKTGIIRIVLLAAGLMGLMSFAAYAETADYKGFERGNALISVQELKQLIDRNDGKLVILAAENNAEYGRGHIPGARQVDRPAYEAPPETQNGVNGNIISPEGFTAMARKLGIDPDSTVVVYDTKYDATRLWWAFSYYGKGDVRVLDGGLKAWKAAGYPIETLAPAAPAKTGTFTARVALPSLRVDTADIVAARQSGKAQLWDNRDSKEFTGEELKKGAVRAGRIPGSVSSDWIHFKKKDNQAEWLPAAELKTVLARQGYDNSKEQYFYCQSGVRSTQAIFALYLTGWPLEKLHNYDSSWIGWSREKSLPLETGIASSGTTTKVN
ncbi:sulfurtransferase [Trichlorobacter ammonificans]|uniref:Rhodanese-like protein y domain pair protein, thiosulfate/3-mercaptopyruvate sulfurtransferase n=1 Tax=Trichlorobacter ammonificans TaxID=2916410 RepID=A0ABM9DC44_9BACT|nr:rhodanese-like domain-containing protein [Trichlorobacter ammonificans]CAH2031980.1 Rhodanese-like protein y domain pair protein, thiosulfate/3-mercaptopyruvate sulfurtransferase [Trichlorobacter ammonificans]